jgi:hypothetical protein
MVAVLARMVTEDWYLILGIGLSLAFVIFMLGDSYRLRNAKTPPLPREKMERGFVPGMGAGDIGMLIFALALVYLGYTLWMQPVHPPFTGRHRGFWSLLYRLGGPYGAALASWLAAALVIITLLVVRRRK